MKREMEEKAAFEALASTTNPTGIVDSTNTPKVAESSDDEKLTGDKNVDEKTTDKNEEAKGSLRDYARIFSFSDRLDRCLYAVALLCSIASGAALPLMVHYCIHITFAPR